MKSLQVPLDRSQRIDGHSSGSDNFRAYLPFGKSRFGVAVRLWRGVGVAPRAAFARFILFFFFTLVTGPRRSLSLKRSDTRVYEPQIRARLGTTAHFLLGELADVLQLRARTHMHQPSEGGQIVFFDYLDFTGAGRNPVTCGTSHGNRKKRFLCKRASQRRGCVAGTRKVDVRLLERGVQTPMARGRST